jgi:hypothetical protein
MNYKKKQLKTFTDLGTTPNEWENHGLVDETLEPVHCELCDHYPIKYLYLLYNERIDKRLLVGSECVKNYISVTYNIPYKFAINKIAYEEFPKWVSKFFTEYKSEYDHDQKEKNLAKSVYELNDQYKHFEYHIKNDIIHPNSGFYKMGNDIRRVYKRALKYEYTIPSTIYRIFELK